MTRPRSVTLVRRVALMACVAFPLLAAAACSKGSSGDPPLSPSSTPLASSGATPAPSAAASAPASVGGTTSWRGSYKSALGTLTLPKDVSWRVPESTAGVGEGAMALTIDRDGRVAGTVEGPLGPATVSGRVADRRVAALVVRRDPADLGFTGSLLGDEANANDKAPPDKLTGTMHLTVGDATAVRTAAFELTAAR